MKKMFGALLFLPLAGCAMPAGPEAVLAGDWTFTGDDGTVFVIHFNDAGVVTNLRATLDDGTSASVNVLRAETTLDVDQNVTIAVTLYATDPPEGGMRTFTGIFDETDNTITGMLDRGATLGRGTIVLQEGELTFQRVM